MTTRRLAAAAIMGAIALVAWSPASAQDGDYRAAVEAMQQFLTDWVIDYDEVATLSHFGAAALETFTLVPASVRPGEAAWTANVPAGAARPAEEVWANGPGNHLDSGYWAMLTSTWPSGPNVDVPLRDVLTVDPDVRAFITTELSGKIVHEHAEGAFIVFAAYDDVGIHSFDAGYGDVADHLRPSREKPTLTLIAGFHEPRIEAAGPFVSFWARDGEAWRIQALGAYPKY